VKLVWWMTHQGQKYAEPMEYAPLSKAAAEKAEKLLKSVTYGGKPVMK
jgi:phosphate transport system substrate-binding protein